MVTDKPAGRPRRTRREHIPLSAQPYRLPKRAPVVAYGIVFVMIMATVIVSAEQRGFNWLWVFPFLATAATVYGYRRERAAKNMIQGSLWALAQVVCGLGALALIALPTKY
jgi:hypothetical protein